MYISINQELKEITSYIIIFIGISDNFPYQKSCPERRREARALPQPSPHSSSSSSILELTLPPQGAGAFLRPWEGCACLCLSLIQCQPGELWRVSVHKDKLSTPPAASTAVPGVLLSPLGAPKGHAASQHPCAFRRFQNCLRRQKCGCSVGKPLKLTLPGLELV